MSSRSGTPEDDSMSDVFGAMAQSSPLAPPRPAKRPHTAVDPGDDDDDDDPPNPTTLQVAPIPNQNVVLAATRYADRKRVKAEQKVEVEAFLQDPPQLREAKLLVNLMVVQNQVEKIITATAPWQPSADILKNIQNYVAGVLLSSKIRTYKGSTPINIVMEILKQHRFDLPPGIEHNPADYSKVIAAVQEALTQKRLKFKKLIIVSLKPNDTRSPDIAPKAERLNIFELTQLFVEGTRCSVNVPVCARVALMRKTFLEDPSMKFWDSVDKDLAKIRNKAAGDSKKLVRAFRHILTTDQEKHGVKEDYTIEEETADFFQQQVDDVIDANVVNAATTA
ncbi:hypothetical protein DFH06DRAFT_1369978 [Mycena polygramma]|nr:hypothetical protein DFH06DRAFT_1369978 [Mycena polygramma]